VRKEYLRIIDDNLNRAKEGLRVVEEVARFILNDADHTGKLKAIRQKLSRLPESFPEISEIISSRDSVSDVGANATLKERKALPDLVRANLSRAQEALRVLEEFCDDGMPFQALRYETYVVEKEILEKIRK